MEKTVTIITCEPRRPALPRVAGAGVPRRGELALAETLSKTGFSGEDQTATWRAAGRGAGSTANDGSAREAWGSDPVTLLVTNARSGQKRWLMAC